MKRNGFDRRKRARLFVAVLLVALLTSILLGMLLYYLGRLQAHA